MAKANVTTLRKIGKQMGPRTIDGKRRALEARLRGKLPHSAMIVPGVETAEEWEHFRAAIVADYAPEGPVETELADRIAHQFWRLRRFARYEADRAAWRMKCAPVEYHHFCKELTDGLHTLDVPSPLPSFPLDSSYYLRGPAALQRDALWYASPATAKCPPDEEHEDGADTLVRAAAIAAGLSGYKVPSKTVWNVGEVRAHLATIAKLGDLTEDKLLAAVAAKADEEIDKQTAYVAAQQATYDTALSEFRRTLTLPTESEIRNASRWESHLERSLCRMMDRLERIQRIRAGEFVQAPALVDINLDRDDIPVR